MKYPKEVIVPVRLPLIEANKLQIRADTYAGGNRSLLIRDALDRYRPKYLIKRSAR